MIIKGQSHQDDVTVINNYEPKNWFLNTKAKNDRVKGEITNLAIVVGEFSALFSITAKTTK